MKKIFLILVFITLVALFKSLSVKDVEAQSCSGRRWNPSEYYCRRDSNTGCQVCDQGRNEQCGLIGGVCRAARMEGDYCDDSSCDYCAAHNVFTQWDSSVCTYSDATPTPGGGGEPCANCFSAKGDCSTYDCGTTGWACDKDDYSVPTYVTVLDRNASRWSGYTIAAGPGGSSNCDGNNNHGFNIDLSSFLPPGANEIDVWAVEVDKNGFILFGQAQKICTHSLNCSCPMPPPPSGRCTNITANSITINVSASNNIRLWTNVPAGSGPSCVNCSPGSFTYTGLTTGSWYGWDIGVYDSCGNLQYMNLSSWAPDFGCTAAAPPTNTPTTRPPTITPTSAVGTPPQPPTATPTVTYQCSRCSTAYQYCWAQFRSHFPACTDVITGSQVYSTDCSCPAPVGQPLCPDGNAGSCTPSSCNLVVSGDDPICVGTTHPYTANVVGTDPGSVTLTKSGCVGTGSQTVSSRPYFINAAASSVGSGSVTATATGCTQGTKSFSCISCVGPTNTPTNTPRPTATPTNRPTATPTPTNTPSPTPTPMDCNIVLSPDNPSRDIGTTTTFNVNFSRRLGTVSSASFSLQNMSRAGVASIVSQDNTNPDPYWVRVSADLDGTVDIYGRITMSDGNVCSDTTRLTVRAPTCSFNLSGPTSLELMDTGNYIAGSLSTSDSSLIDWWRLTSTDPGTISVCSRSTTTCLPGNAVETVLPGGSYRANGTGYAITSSDVTLRAEMSMAGSVRCSDTISVGVLNADPWFQAAGGGVTAGNGQIYSDITAACPLTGCSPFLILDGLGGFPGVAGRVGLGNITPTVPAISSKNWNFSAPYQGEVYDYQYFVDRLPQPGKTVSAIGDMTGGPVSSGFELYQASGDFTLGGSLSLGSRKVILMVPGNLTINGKINLTKGFGNFVAIVQGNIVVSSSVGDPFTLTPNPDLEGIYFAQGNFVTQSAGDDSDAQLMIRGMVVGMGTPGVDLHRDLPNNTLGPAEIFEFGPDINLSFPPFFGKRGLEWREVAP